jgi:hypothetical protein
VRYKYHKYDWGYPVAVNGFFGGLSGGMPLSFSPSNPMLKGTRRLPFPGNFQV